MDNGIVLTVVDIDQNRIQKVQMTLPEPPTEDAEVKDEVLEEETSSEEKTN